MSDMSEFVKGMAFRFSNHAHQTRNFTWDYLSASDEEVNETTFVFEETLDGLANVILKIAKPETVPTLRKQIAYLIGLRQRQSEAWQRLLDDSEQRFEKTKQWVLQNQ